MQKGRLHKPGLHLRSGACDEPTVLKHTAVAAETEAMTFLLSCRRMQAVACNEPTVLENAAVAAETEAVTCLMPCPNRHTVRVNTTVYLLVVVFSVLPVIVFLIGLSGDNNPPVEHPAVVLCAIIAEHLPISGNLRRVLRGAARREVAPA